MPNTYLSTPLIFLIETLFGLYIALVALRIIMQWAQWEYHNPLVQFIIKTTQLPVKFLRQFIPAIGRVDTATIVLLVVLTVIKLLLVYVLKAYPLNIVMLLRFTLADIVSLFITLFTVSIIVQAIMSWVGTNSNYNPITPLLSRMNSPLLKPVRQIMPALGGIDLSPLVVIIGLQLLGMLVIPPLTGFHGYA